MGLLSLVFFGGSVGWEGKLVSFFYSRPELSPSWALSAVVF